jgi:hypothetical protein
MKKCKKEEEKCIVDCGLLGIHSDFDMRKN